MKRWLAVLLALMLALACSPAAGAEEEVPYIDESGTHTIGLSGVTVLSGSDPVPGNTLAAGWYLARDCSFSGRLTVSGEVRLILADGCTMQASQGINVTGANALHIYGQSNAEARVGKLVATGGDYDACIGGDGSPIFGNGQDCGAVSIHSGAVQATGSRGAGIGGGGSADFKNGGSGGEILITGGFVDAESLRGAGIGGGGCDRGSGGSGGVIRITGGFVDAESTFSAGIGGGSGPRNAGSGGEILITGGYVDAKSQYGAGIGGGAIGPFGSGGVIRITGGFVNAKSQYGAGIGGGGEHRGNGGNTTIEGGEVVARSTGGGAGIGGARYGDGGNILIRGGKVTATSEVYGAGIGGGEEGNGGTVTIEGGSVVATCLLEGGAGIGGGSEGGSGTIIIRGDARVEAHGGRAWEWQAGGAGIGSGGGTIGDPAGAVDSITVSVPVNATGGEGNARFGGGAAIGSGGSGLSLEPGAEVDTRIIFTKPDPTTVDTGEPVSFSVAITPYDPSASYAWQKSGGTGWTDVGTNSASFTISSAQPSDGGEYHCVVTIGGAEYPTETVRLTIKEAQPNAGIDYAREQLTGLVGSAAYTVDGDAGTSDADGNMAIDAEWFDKTLSIVKVASNAYCLDSEEQSLPIPALPAAPSVSAIQPTVIGGTGGISGTSEAMEYSKDKISWTTCANDSTTGLDPGTYYVRIKQSGSAFAGTMSIVIIEPTTEPTPDAKIDYAGEQLTGLAPGADYTVDGNPETSDAAGNMVIDSAWFGKTLSIVKIGNGTTTTDSDAQSLSIPARPAAPTVGKVNETGAGAGNGRITGVDTTMEYRLITDSNWTACTGTEITGLAPGNYQVRLKATEADFAGEAADVTIAAGPTPAPALTVAPQALTLNPGETGQLTASEGGVTWSSSDGKVATVSVNGLVTAVAEGSATVTAKALDGRTASCGVTVEAAPEPPEVFDIGIEVLAVRKGKELILPKLTGYTGSWSVDNEHVAKITKNGKRVKAVGLGTAVLTFHVDEVVSKKAEIVLEDRKLKAGERYDITFNVRKAGELPTKITLDAKELTLNLNENKAAKLTATVNPAKALDKQVFWTSNKPGVVTVDRDGTVRAVAPGKAKITAVSANLKRKTITVTVLGEVTKVTLSAKKQTLKVGDTFTLTATVNEDALDKTITWTSGKPNVATVKDGVVTAVKKGKVKITATAANGKKAVCTITVK